mmetsp:Transcript_125569/g.250516  ORF Transcript_125569/g.250516 Transcript_125569/m.250516 type:complete len:335 (-) Transcript_125569:14-1018(-)
MGQGGSSSDFHERFFVQKVKLGHGTSGTVWRAVDRQSGGMVAIKQMDKEHMKRNNISMSDIKREVAVMKACAHENITRLLEACEDEECAYLVLEYCECGDLCDKIEERGLDISEAEAADWMRQILASISALHSKEICHRDIKPANFMIKSGLLQSQGFQEVAPSSPKLPGAVRHILKLADFGLATFHRKGQGLRRTRCGTPHFMAPELHFLPKKSRGYDLPIDVWAAGVSMYAIMFGGQRPLRLLVTGTVDWQTHQNCFMGLSELRFSEDARQLCTKMLQIDPSKRTTADQALQSPWLERTGTGKLLDYNSAYQELSPSRRWRDLPMRQMGQMK